MLVLPRHKLRRIIDLNCRIEFDYFRASCDRLEANKSCEITNSNCPLKVGEVWIRKDGKSGVLGPLPSP